MKGDPVVVAGAGPAGLYAARHMARSGRLALVVEREPVVGGLAAALRFGGHVFGHGFHALHDPDPEFLRPFRDLAGPAVREFRRSVAIKLRGRFHDYPLQPAGAWRGFSPLDLGLGLAGFLGASVRAPFRRRPPADAEEAIVRLYGRSLYRTYFAEYTDRFWGLPAKSISPRFVAERLPRFDPAERLRGLLSGRRRKSGGGAARLTEIGRPTMLTTASGTGAFFEAMADDLSRRGVRVRTGCEVREVILEGGRIVGIRVGAGAGGEEIACRMLVSTLPVGALTARLRPSPPAGVLAAASELTHRGLLTVGLVVARRRVLPRGLVYFHGRTFHRLSEPGISGVDVVPEGHTVLLAELTADPGEPAWEDRAGLIASVIRDLAAEGLIEPAEVREARVAAAPEAYPRYLLGFESRLKTVRDYLASIPNLVSTGRQGRFAFLRSAEAMRAAQADAERFLRG